MKRKINPLSIVMYVLAVIAAVYAIYALFSSISYIGEMASTGYITVSDSFSDIIGYIMQNAGSPIFSAVGFFFFGYVINILKPGKEVPVEAEVEVAEEAEAEEAAEDAVVEYVADDAEAEAEEVAEEAVEAEEE